MFIFKWLMLYLVVAMVITYETYSCASDIHFPIINDCANLFSGCKKNVVIRGARCKTDVLCLMTIRQESLLTY
jgi:hypothetical protein